MSKWGTTKEGYCPKRKDETHCVHWWDGGICCNCGDGPMSDKEKIEVGMESEGSGPTTKE